MKPLKYCNEMLKQFCLENGVELCRDYSNDLVRRETIIEGKCTAEGCDNIFNKSFRELKQNMSYFCTSCTYDSALLKRKKTCLEQYGVEHALQNDIIKNKAKETLFQNWGVKNPSQNKDIQNKIKETSLKNWGVDHQSKSEIIKNKKIETCKINNNCNYPMQNLLTQQKSKETSLKNWGTEYPSQSQDFKNKIKETSLKIWGTEYPSQSKEIKLKKENTCLKKYGVKNPIQNAIIAERALNGFYVKEYIFPSGNIIKCQGYENYALDDLIQNENINEELILTSRIDVPDIWYNDINRKKRKHYVDIFIPSQNRCIEVKSEWTINITTSNVFLKQQAAKEQGYKYEIWVYNKKGIKTKCYQ
jgi:hypothetical protein